LTSEPLKWEEELVGLEEQGVEELVMNEE